MDKSGCLPQGLNVALYWKNPDPRKYVNIVPTSAISGEGIPDMLQLLVKLTQAHLLCPLMQSVMSLSCFCGRSCISVTGCSLHLEWHLDKLPPHIVCMHRMDACQQSACRLASAASLQSRGGRLQRQLPDAARNPPLLLLCARRA